MICYRLLFVFQNHDAVLCYRYLIDRVNRGEITKKATEKDEYQMKKVNTKMQRLEVQSGMVSAELWPSLY